MKPTATNACPNRLPCVAMRLLMFLFAVAARGHEPFEITTDARLLPDRLELLVTMARSTAMAVAAGGKPTPAFDPERFDEVRARLEACTGRLFAVTSGGVAVGLRGVKVELSRELDVEFRLAFARPAKPPLRFKATHVTTLPEGYGVVLTVTGPGVMLGQKLLVAEDPSLDVDVPPVIAAKPPAGPPQK